MKWLAANIVVDGRTFTKQTNKPNSQANQDKYENEVLSIGSKIRQAPFGRQLLDLISVAQEIIIAQSTDSNNATTDVAVPSRRPDAFPLGFPIPGGGSGTGKGAMSVVPFNPHGTFFGISADVTLLHELLHAYRQASGRWSPLPMLQFVNKSTAGDSGDENWVWGNWEEWFSVVAEDIYASESGATTVRMSHQQWAWALTANKPAGSPKNFFHPDAMTPSEFFSHKYLLAIDRIMTQEPTIYNIMKRSSAWFNPVKDFDQRVWRTRK
jgi:hypothetical protein